MKTIVIVIATAILLCGCSKPETPARSDYYTNSYSAELETRLQLAEWAYDAAQAQDAMDEYSKTYGGKSAGIDPDRMSKSSLFAVTNDIASNFMAQVNGALK